MAFLVSRGFPRWRRPAARSHPPVWRRCQDAPRKRKDPRTGWHLRGAASCPPPRRPVPQGRPWPRRWT